MNVIRRLVFAALAAVLLSAGCSRPPGGAPDTADTASKTTASKTTVDRADTIADRETWDVYMIRGARVGYGRTVVKRRNESGREIVRIEGLTHLAVKRFGQETVQEIRFICNETPDGGLIDFSSEIQQGPVPMRVSGRTLDEKLDIEIVTQGKKQQLAIPWKGEYGGFCAGELSLSRKPMKPGEQRTVRALAVGLYQVAAGKMTAGDYESVRLPGGAYDLLRIDTTTTFPDGTTLQGTVWTDRAGETLKTFADVLNIETFRVTKAVALEEIAAVELDLGWDIAVKLDRPIDRPHAAKRLRYRVGLKDGDPAAVFVSGPSQAVKPLDPHTAEITVYAIRGGQTGGNPDAPDDPPTDADLQPNNMIQSDDARIVAEANQAAGGERDPWKIAVALERYVHDEITENDFSQAFATAADVARTRQGDCSEHAVFLAALARARGIPARVAVGLVYMEGTQSFGYHAWTEVHIDGRWVPLDATLAKGGIGAGHLKLGHGSLAGVSAYSALLPVIQVAGRLTIELP